MLSESLRSIRGGATYKSTGQFLDSPSDAPPLKVALLVSGNEAAAYARAVIEVLARSAHIALVGVVTLQKQALDAVRLTQDALLFDLYSARFDSRSLPSPNVQELVSVKDLIARIPTRVGRVWKAGHGLQLDDASCEFLQEAAVEVVLDLSGVPQAVRAGPAVRNGVWSIGLGDSRSTEAWPGLMGVLLESASLCPIELRMASSKPASDRVLARAKFSSLPTMSMSVAAEGPLAGFWCIVPQKLRELHMLGAGEFHRGCEPNSGEQRIRSPGNLRMGSWLARQAARQMARRVRPLRIREHWKIGIRKSPVPLYRDPGPRSLAEFSWLESPEGAYWADPFIHQYKGDYWLLFEEMDLSVRRAHLSCGALDGSLLREVRPILKLPTHLSYPQIIECEGEIFMVPENAEGGGVDLYRARHFPHDWKLECRLLDFPCVDSTVFKTEGAWWMVTSLNQTPITWLFTADRLTGPWRIHSSNPVSMDARDARGAGNFLWQDATLIRPSQECDGEYGKALRFNVVTGRLGQQWEERLQCRIGAGWAPALTGVHTYNRCGDWEVIDGKFVVPT